MDPFYLRGPTADRCYIHHWTGDRIIRSECWSFVKACLFFFLFFLNKRQSREGKGIPVQYNTQDCAALDVYI